MIASRKSQSGSLGDAFIYKDASITFSLSTAALESTRTKMNHFFEFQSELHSSTFLGVLCFTCFLRRLLMGVPGLAVASDAEAADPTEGEGEAVPTVRVVW